MSAWRVSGSLVLVGVASIATSAWLQANAGVSPQATASRASQMHANFARVGAVELAVVRGDLQDVADPARWLAANVTSEGFPPAAEQPVAALKAAAARAAEATDLPSAAAAVGSLVAACGSCHAATHAEVKITTAPRPPAAADAVARMRQHNWAVEVLSVGLAEPSDAMWREGAEALSGLPLAPSDLPGDPSHVSQVRELAAEVRDLASRAATARQSAERAALYGRIITTCGSCHGLNGIVLGPGIPLD